MINALIEIVNYISEKNATLENTISLMARSSKKRS